MENDTLSQSLYAAHPKEKSILIKAENKKPAPFLWNNPEIENKMFVKNTSINSNFHPFRY